MSDTRKAVLIIMDGWGHGPKPEDSAIVQANTPYVDSLYHRWPNTELRTDGEFVGLPEGQMGNSEVGHLNIGAGRIVFQELLRIHNAVRDQEFEQNPVLLEAIDRCKSGKHRLHIMGLVSLGGVHSHVRHLEALSELAAQRGLKEHFVHAFTDGRDVDPRSAAVDLANMEIAASGGKLASVVGRYYAMDRDQRWPRIRKAYDLLLKGTGTKATDAVEAVQASYAAGITDEFIEPICLQDEQGQDLPRIQPGDSVICFNFRTDRCRQITRVLTQEDMPEESMKTVDLHYVTMTKYDDKFQGVRVVFEKEDLRMTMGELLSRLGKTQIRIAETEKYPHVTFFFSGGRETEFEGERRIMIPSPKVATYDLQPEMSAFEVRDAILPELEKGEVDFVCLNFANADMVGHTGDMNAAMTACETVDQCLRAVCERALASGYSILLTADHGNADKMRNADGSPNTAHTTHPVPLFLLDPEERYTTIKPGKLADLAPTLLTLMGIPIPEEMTGEVLV